MPRNKEHLPHKGKERKKKNKKGSKVWLRTRRRVRKVLMNR